MALLILTLIDNHPGYQKPSDPDPDPHHDVLSRDLVAGQRKSVGCLCHLLTIEPKVLLGTARCYLVLLGVTWCYLVLVGFTWCYLVLVGFNWCYLVLLGASWFYLVLLGASWFYLVLLGVTWC